MVNKLSKYFCCGSRGLFGKAVLALIVLSLPLMSAVGSTALAQSTIGVQSSSAKIDFPVKITFNLSANGSAPITDIRLRFTVEREGYANVFSDSFVEFNPSTTVTANWVMDMQRVGGLPPGTILNYWWLVTDETGNQLETKPQQVEFSDNRYQWRNLSQGLITLYWYQGDNAFADSLMTIAQEALLRLQKDTGATVTKPIKIFIYAGSQALQGSMVFPAEWTGGVAFTEYSIIAIGITPSNLTWGMRAMAHELTHLVIHQMTYNPYNQLPTWLDEGIAVYNEGPPDSTFIGLVKRALANDQLISLQSLSSPFSAYSEAASLSYAQSYSVVDYLIATYGQSKMLELLNTFRQGSAYNSAFEKVYGFSINQLNDQWKQYLQKQNTSQVQPRSDKSLIGSRLPLQYAILALG
jgi:hypothetical protein